MKAIIILLLTIVVAIMGYNFYRNWQRFNPPNYEYQAQKSIDANHPDKALWLDYQDAIATLNGHVITQWSAHGIDVRNPKDDDKQTLAAVAHYNSLQGNVKYFESQLLAEVPKKESQKPSAREERLGLIRKMFYMAPTGDLRLGQKNALIFEVQRLLNEKGATIANDGVYRTETKTAIEVFEAKNGLFPDGMLDALTLEILLK